MSGTAPTFASLDDWVAREAIAFDAESQPSVDSAVDRLVGVLGSNIELLGLGEPTHCVDVFLQLRNRVFQRLVESHGYTAIAIESSFPRGRLVNDYILGRGAASYDDIAEAGFSHGFSRMAANRELVEWMRAYNAEFTHPTKLHFYGFDAPTEMMYADSPRQAIQFVLQYLGVVDGKVAQSFRDRIEPLIGSDGDWENEAAAMDPTKSIGLSSQAAALRVAVEDLAVEVALRQPELIAASGVDRFKEAAQLLSCARQLLSYHAVFADTSDERLARGLAHRDAVMADNLVYAVGRERSRPTAGKLFAFAHNMHLQCGKAAWQWGPNALAWWPAGAHLRQLRGDRYAVIGVGVGAAESIGIAAPETGTIEARLKSSTSTAFAIPTFNGHCLPANEVATLPTRSTGNAGYFPFSSQSLTDFDALVVLNSLS